MKWRLVPCVNEQHCNRGDALCNSSAAGRDVFMLAATHAARATSLTSFEYSTQARVYVRCAASSLTPVV